MKRFTFLKISCISILISLVIFFNLKFERLSNFLSENTSLISLNSDNSNLSRPKNDISSKRLLFSQQEYKDLCGDTNYTEYITNDNALNLYNNFSNILSNYTYVKEDQTENIRNLIIGDDKNTALRQFVVETLAAFIIFWILAIITVIAWIVYCVCCCCKACLCCKRQEPESKASLCNLISFILITLAVLGVIAVCIVGFVASGKFSERVDDSQCALMKFYLDAKDGETKNSTPRWIGVNGVNNKMDGLIVAIDNLRNNANGAFNDISFVDNDFKSYNDALLRSNDNFDDRTTISPDPNNKAQITPGFIKVKNYYIYFL